MIGFLISYVDFFKLWVCFVEDNDIFYLINWILDGMYFLIVVFDCDLLDFILYNYFNFCCYVDIQGFVLEGMYFSLLNGGIVLQKLVVSICDYFLIVYFYLSYFLVRVNVRIFYVLSIDIVIIKDIFKWI